MTEQSAQRAILLATFVTLASTAGSSLRNTQHLPPTRELVGGLLAMMGCAVVAEIDTRIGVGLAVAISGTAFVTYGLPALDQGFTQNQNKAAKPRTLVQTLHSTTGVQEFTPLKQSSLATSKG